jgi:rare lipoprotein A
MSGRQCARPQALQQPAQRLFLPALAAALLASGCVSGPPIREAPPSSPATPAPAPLPIPQPPTNVEAIPDAVPKLEPRSAHGNPPFYDVLGRRYFVLASGDGYLERGVASWYGPTFHGEHTSSGESYDMYGMTAAHKTLPLPTYARVTNLKNGRSIIVRINDRGPFVANRLIDLSYTAALKLDMVREGTTLVEVRALTPNQPDVLTRSQEAPPPALYVQAGAYSNERNAERTVERLHTAGLTTAFVLQPGSGSATPLFRVRLGPVSSVSEFDSVAARLAKLGFADARLAAD